MTVPVDDRSPPSLGFFCFAILCGLFLALAAMGFLWLWILILASLPAQF